MPIASGAKGRVNALLAPRGGYRARSFDGQSAESGGRVMGGFGSRTQNEDLDGEAIMPFRSQPFSTLSLYVTGTAKDRDTLAAVVGATLHLFRTSDDIEVDQATSDGSGNFTLRTAGTGPFYVKGESSSGATFGCTINTLQGAVQY